MGIFRHTSLDHEIYRFQSTTLVDRVVDDPRLRLVVASDLTWTGRQSEGRDMTEAAEAIAGIAEEYELAPDDMEKAIELCRSVLRLESRQASSK